MERGELNCGYCGAAFRPNASAQAYCCVECRRAHWREIDRERQKAKRQAARLADLRDREEKRSLSQVAKEAREAGMTYGQYSALLAAREREEGRRK